MTVTSKVDGIFGDCADICGAIAAAEPAGRRLLRQWGILDTNDILDLSRDLADCCRLVTL